MRDVLVAWLWRLLYFLLFLKHRLRALAQRVRRAIIGKSFAFSVCQMSFMFALKIGADGLWTRVRVVGLVVDRSVSMAGTT